MHGKNDKSLNFKTDRLNDLFIPVTTHPLASLHACCVVGKKKAKHCSTNQGHHEQHTTCIANIIIVC